GALQMSTIGVKRTWLFAARMSAFDLKQTLPSSSMLFLVDTMIRPEARGRANETTRVHIIHWQCGWSMASDGGFAAGADPPERREPIRRIGVLMNIAENDPQSVVRVSALVRGLEELGWIVGRNVQIDYRWAAGDANLYRKYAPELVALAPDVIVVVGGTAVSE